jgi:hypothetical protein
MPTRRCCLLLLHVASVILAHRADAQDLASGQRVRVMESTSRRTLVVGQLIRQTNDSVVIRPDSASTSGYEQVWVLQPDHRIEQSAGLRGRTRKGMGVGLLVGIIGHSSKHETWRSVSDRRPRVMVAPRPSGGIRFSAFMPF